MAYKGQVNRDARKKKVIVSVNREEYAVLVARAAACTGGNVALYIRQQVFGAQDTQEASEATVSA